MRKKEQVLCQDRTKTYPTSLRDVSNIIGKKKVSFRIKKKIKVSFRIVRISKTEM